jgi:diguanylate cyclase (GGDEF)-like protein
MNFDTATLMVAGSIITAVGGMVLLAVWNGQRTAGALLWWAIAYLCSAAGIGLLAHGLPDNIRPLVVVGSLLSDIAPPLVWIGVRIFNRQPLSLATCIVAVGGWLAFDLAVLATTASPVAGFAGWTGWLLLSAFELLRNRSEIIPARRPLAAAFTVHALIYAGGAYDVLSGAFPTTGISPLNSWFGAIFFEGMVFAMCSTILMVLLYRERDTARYAREAASDSLTGIANRRAFLENAERLLLRCQQEEAPCSLIMFDLDRFKSINDTHGHQFGDGILQSFADTAHRLIRPSDLFGRYGGEEFAVVLPNATVQTAYVIADRVRHAFAATQHFSEGMPVGATVSGGVAEAGREASIQEMIQLADRALYRAKDFGRNRIERGGDANDRPASNVIRVA